MGYPARALVQREYTRTTNRETSKPRRRHKASLAPVVFALFMALAVFFGVMVLFNSAQKALLAQNAVELNRLKVKYEAAKEENEWLKAQRAGLVDPQRIEKLAVDKLKMIKPTQITYLTVERSKKLGVESVAMVGK